MLSYFLSNYANKRLYDEIRRDLGMCEALRELMKDDIGRMLEEATEEKGPFSLSFQKVCYGNWGSPFWRISDECADFLQCGAVGFVL